MTARARLTIVACLAAVVGVVVAVVQLRTGIVPMLDTVTYWSGVRATADGHPFTTTLAPSFSNFDLVDFLARDGRLPFVDFPVGYPTIAGLLAVVLGAEPAMVALTVAAVAASAAALVVGPRTLTRWTPLALRLAVAVGLMALPAHRLVTQAALSEPLFVAVAVALALALARHRHGDLPWWPVAALTVAAGLLRFIGAPFAVVAGLVHLRRHGSRAQAAMWTVAMMVPAAANIVWASAAGGGHNAGWRGLDGADVEVAVRSVGGWLEADQGDLRLTYFGGEGPAWWAWPLTALWLVALVMAVAGVALDAFAGSSSDHRARWRLPVSLELPLALAAVLTAGLVLGMLGFDALVIADNRLMLPSGVLTIAAVVWWSTERLDRATSLRPTAVFAAVTALWWLVAVRPLDVTEIFSDPAPARGDIAAVMAAGPAVVVANDADGVHWATSVPAAYAPLPVRALTGEAVDVAAVYAALPCPLAQADGVVVLADDALFGSDGRDELDALVAAGKLTVEPFADGALYRPGSAACS